VDQAASNLRGIPSQVAHFKRFHVLLQSSTVVTLTQLAKVVHAGGKNLVLVCHEERVLAPGCHVDDFYGARNEVAYNSWRIQVESVV